MNAVRCWLLTLVGGVLLAMLAALPASAHATLDRSDPAPEAVLATAPGSITLSFDEPVRVPPQAVRVFDDHGVQVPTTTRAVDADVTATIGTALRNGSYVVSWRVVSADGHPIDGVFDFSVGTPTPITVIPATPEPSDALVLALRIGTGLADAGLLLAVGLGVYARFLLPAGAPLTRRRLALTQRVAAGVAAAGALLIIPLSLLWQDAGRLTDLAGAETWTQLDPGTWLPPVLVIAGTAIMLGLRRSWAVPVGGLLALASLTINGHTRSYGPSWLSYPLDLLHLAAGALWLGALVGIAITLRRRTDAGASLGVAAVARFSALAMETVVVLSVAGTIMAVLIVGSIRGLVQTPWGITLLIKVGVVGLVLAMAAVNRWRVLPALSRAIERDGDGAIVTRLRRTVRVEAVGLAVVVAITGVLVTQSPVPETPATTIGNPTASRTLSNDQPLGRDGLIAFRLTPQRRGTNTVTITLTDGQGQPFTPTDAPELTTSFPALELGPLPQQLVRTGPGVYRAEVDLSYAGSWVLEYAIRLDADVEATPQYPVDIE